MLSPSLAHDMRFQHCQHALLNARANMIGGTGDEIHRTQGRLALFGPFRRARGHPRGRPPRIMSDGRSCIFIGAHPHPAGEGEPHLLRPGGAIL